MKGFLGLVIVVVLGYLGYQLIIEDKSLGQVKREIKEQVSDSKVYLAEKYLKQKISESKPYKKGDFSYRSIKCFDDRTYGVSCKVTKIVPNREKEICAEAETSNTESSNGVGEMCEVIGTEIDRSLQFDLTLFGVGSVMEHKVGLFDLNKANIGIKVDNISTDIFDSDKKLKKIEKHFTDMSAEVYLTSSKYGKHELNFAAQGNRDLSFSSSIEVSKDDKSEEMIEQFSECLGELDCKDYFQGSHIEIDLITHLYFEELNSKIKISKEVANTLISNSNIGLEAELDRMDNGNIPFVYKKSIRNIFSNGRTSSESKVSPRSEVSILEILEALNIDDEIFFKNKFNYEIDGESYNL